MAGDRGSLVLLVFPSMALIRRILKRSSYFGRHTSVDVKDCGILGSRNTKLLTLYD